MKGRIVIDIADDGGALMQIVLLKADKGRSCTKKGTVEQLAEVEFALKEINGPTNTKSNIDIVQ